MRVLLTNDDGINAPGLNDLARLLVEHCDVFVIAPKTEQSGISQAITFLRPLFPIPLPQGNGGDCYEYPGFKVDGTPTDCVKLGLAELCPWKPDLVISGINNGLNAGLNVGYSGTVGGALTGATFDIPSIALSMEYNPTPNTKAAAKVAWPLIQRFSKACAPKSVININIPSSALEGGADVVVAPVETNLLGYRFEQGVDPKGREYYWSSNQPRTPRPSGWETDCTALKDGKISVSPISFDLNHSPGMDLLNQANPTNSVSG